MSKIKLFNEYWRNELNKINKKLTIDNCEKIRRNCNGVEKSIIETLTNQQLQKKFIDYRSLFHSYTYENPLTFSMVGELDEGLIHSYPVDKTIQYISDYFELDSDDIMKKKCHDGTYQILIRVPIVGDNVKQVKKAMRLCGYYLGSPKEDNLPSNYLEILQFEPEIKPNITDELRKTEDKLYHLTTKHNYNKIKHIGFSPRCKHSEFDYLGRVYFIKGSTDRSDIMKLCDELKEKNTSSVNNQYVLLTIDLHRIPEQVKFSIDSNYPNGVYTRDNISPDVITDVEYI